jgi:hypothetical protein
MIADERHGGSEEPRRAIGYGSRYSDRIEEDDEEGELGAEGRAIEDGNDRGNDLGRGQQPSIENEWARG